MYAIERQQWVPYSRPETFRFFSDARNLELLTPPWLAFDILTPKPIVMEVGTLIDYRIRMAGIPLKWRTEIEEWVPEERFVDMQLRGPYRSWRHVHSFKDVGSGTLITDSVRYALPFGLLGNAVHGISVRSMLARIFDYRFHVIRNVFPDLNELEPAGWTDATDREIL